MRISSEVGVVIFFGGGRRWLSFVNVGFLQGSREQRLFEQRERGKGGGFQRGVAKEAW